MKKLLFVLTVFCFPLLCSANDAEQTFYFDEPATAPEIQQEMSDVDVFRASINTYREQIKLYFDELDTNPLYKTHPQLATEQAQVNHVVQQIFTGTLYKTYKAVYPKISTAERYQLLRELNKPLNTKRGQFVLRTFLSNDRMRLCEHSEPIINAAQRLLRDIDAAMAQTQL